MHAFLDHKPHMYSAGPCGVHTSYSASKSAENVGWGVCTRKQLQENRPPPTPKVVHTLQARVTLAILIGKPIKQQMSKLS